MYLGYTNKEIKLKIVDFGRKKGYNITTGDLKKIGRGDLYTAFSAIVMHHTTPRLLKNKFRKLSDQSNFSRPDELVTKGEENLAEAALFLEPPAATNTKQRPIFIPRRNKKKVMVITHCPSCGCFLGDTTPMKCPNCGDQIE